MKRAPIIGIDLGTTNSCVATVDERGVPFILDVGGARTIPSMVAFTNDGVLVGEPARRQMVTNAARTIFGAKRLVGRKVNAEDVSWFARTAPFRIVAAANGDAWVRVGTESKSPQEVASFILRRLRQVAEEYYGHPVTQAVVTVPAYFNDAQRQATKDAGTIAGLDVLRIVNEPTAAALAYGAHRVGSERRVIAVFDLGGGTFDISIMSVDDGVFEVLATNGDVALGGEDWDRRLIDRMVDEVFDQHRVDLTSLPIAIGRLKEAAEQAKKSLSHQEETIIHLPYLIQSEGRDLHWQRKVTRVELEALTKDLLDRLVDPCVQALVDAGLEPADIEEVLLVGGMTRWPAAQNVVAEIFEQKPSKGAHPDEVVALGAAAHAAILAGTNDDAVLLDVTPHSIGIRVGDSGFATIIPRNAMLPVRERKLFATTRDDQEFFSIEIFQGESTEIEHNRKLGEVKMTGLPAGPAGTVKLELAITIDVESILQVTARELSTGKRAQVTIQATGGLSADDLINIVRRRRRETVESGAAGA